MDAGVNTFIGTANGGRKYDDITTIELVMAVKQYGDNMNHDMIKYAYSKWQAAHPGQTVYDIP